LQPRANLGEFFGFLNHMCWITRLRSRECSRESSYTAADDEKRDSGRPSHYFLRSSLCALRNLLPNAQSRSQLWSIHFHFFNVTWMTEAMTFGAA
jgi:hypothetical protein